MNASGSRITDPDNPPSDSAVADWLGKEAYKYWQQVMDLIGQYYPNTFTPEWLFGGKKHGWSLRYKKSKSFCTLIPEQYRFLLLIVFGKEDRAKVEAIRESLSQDTQKQYDEATTITTENGSFLTSIQTRLLQMSCNFWVPSEKQKIK